MDHPFLVWLVQEDSLLFEPEQMKFLTLEELMELQMLLEFLEQEWESLEQLVQERVFLR